MGFNYVFIWVIYALVFVLVLFVIKTIFQNKYLKKAAIKSELILQENLFQESNKLEKAKQKLLLVEDLHHTLFKRFFKITEDILLMQKFMFEIHTK